MTNVPAAEGNEPEAGAPELNSAEADALDRLARRLYEVMEWLDPGPCDDIGPDDLHERWGALDERSKRFYRLSVANVLAERPDVFRVLKIEYPDNDVKVRGVD